MAKNLFVTASPASKLKAAIAKDNATTVEGLEMYASIKVVEDALSAVKEVYEGQVKVHMHETFVKLGTTLHKRPENLKGEEGDANASLQLRKRSTASKLNEQDAEVLRQSNIPIEDVPASFTINPKYVEDTALMARINAAIVKHVKDVPDDLFVVETGRAIVTDESIDAVFRMNDPDTIAALLPLVTTLSIRAKLKDNMVATMQKAFARVANALGNELTLAPDAKKARVETLPTFARAKKKAWNND